MLAEARVGGGHLRGDGGVNGVEVELIPTRVYQGFGRRRAGLGKSAEDELRGLNLTRQSAAPNGVETDAFAGQPGTQ